MGERLKIREAARLLGVGPSTVPKMVARGELTSHGHRPGGCLDLDDVEQLVLERARRTRDAAERRARPRVRPSAAIAAPPDDEHDWLTVPQAGAMVGITRKGMALRCQRDAVPYEWSCGCRWIRRDLLELVERAHAAQRAAR